MYFSMFHNKRHANRWKRKRSKRQSYILEIKRETDVFLDHTKKMSDYLEIKSRFYFDLFLYLKKYMFKTALRYYYYVQENKYTIILIIQTNHSLFFRSKCSCSFFWHVYLI